MTITNKNLKIHQATFNSINKGVNLCDKQLSKKTHSDEWHKMEEELIALYLEVGRNIVLDNFLPY